MTALEPTTIIYPNAKGQITIPKKLRDSLDINPTTPLAPILDGNSITFIPVASVQAKPAPWNKTNQAQVYQNWKKTQGAWANDDTWDQTTQQRKKIELQASKRRKQAW